MNHRSQVQILLPKVVYCLMTYASITSCAGLSVEFQLRVQNQYMHCRSWQMNQRLQVQLLFHKTVQCWLPYTSFAGFVCGFLSCQKLLQLYHAQVFLFLLNHSFQLTATASLPPTWDGFGSRNSPGNPPSPVQQLFWHQAITITWQFVYWKINK